MDIYSVFMLIAIILALFLPEISSQEERFTSKKKVYCRILGFNLFLIAALRSTSVGIDLVN